jgi:hypothetical protein
VKEILVTHRSYALALVWSLGLSLGLSAASASSALAQDEAQTPNTAATSGSIDNEMPPGDPPKVKQQEIGEAPPAEGSIRDNAEKRRPYAVSLLAAMPWLYSIGGGARVAGEIPVVHNGFIPSINDSFSLEPLFEFSYGLQHNTVWEDVHGISLTPALSVLWSFYFKPQLRAYAAFSFGYTIVLDDYEGNGADLNLNHFHHNFAVGMFYDVAQHWSVRAEIGYQGLRAGIAYLI